MRTAYKVALMIIAIMMKRANKTQTTVSCEMCKKRHLMVVLLRKVVLFMLSGSRQVPA